MHLEEVNFLLRSNRVVTIHCKVVGFARLSTCSLGAHWMLSCTTQYKMNAGLGLSFITETVAFCIAHLNTSRLSRIFYLGWELTSSYRQGATVAGCRTKSRGTGLTSRTAQQNQKSWWLLGSARSPERVQGDEAGPRWSQDGTNQEGTQPGTAQLHHSCIITALVGSEGTEQLLKSSSQVKLEELLPRPFSRAFLKSPLHKVGVPHHHLGQPWNSWRGQMQ